MNSGSELNTLIVPPGQRIKLILSDNTNLYLMLIQNLVIPKFSKRTDGFPRRGSLFEVSENEKKPLIVKQSR